MHSLKNFNKLITRFTYIKSDNYSYKLLAKDANLMFTENLFLKSQMTEQQKKNHSEWLKKIYASMEPDQFPGHTTHG